MALAAVTKGHPEVTEGVDDHSNHVRAVAAEEVAELGHETSSLARNSQSSSWRNSQCRSSTCSDGLQWSASRRLIVRTPSRCRCRLQAVVLTGPGALTGHGAGVMGDDRGQVALGEAAVDGAMAERPVGRLDPGQLGQGHGFGHLGPHPGGARCPGLLQPQGGAGTDGQELGLSGVGRHRGPVQGSLGAGGKCESSIRGLPGVVRLWRATSAGPSPPMWVMITSSPRKRAETTSPARPWGTEYKQWSTAVVHDDHGLGAANGL